MRKMTTGSNTAMPDSLRFILVALASMVAYRFVNELSGPDAPSAGNATAASSTGKVEPVSMDVGHAFEEAESEAEDTKRYKKRGKVGSTRRHRLKKNEVLIEFCTS